jgi:hypothetical protein
MIITKRTLEKWRKEAIIQERGISIDDPLDQLSKIIHEYSGRILRMTQELLDQHLIGRK